MAKNEIIIVKGIPITTFKRSNEDYISLTDIARNKNAEEPKDVVKNWMRSRTTIEFLGIWEQLNNPDFKGVEFDSFKMQAGLPTFVLSVSEWIEKTNAIGMIVKMGKYGGTFAHRDILYNVGILYYKNCSCTLRIPLQRRGIYKAWFYNYIVSVAWILRYVFLNRWTF